MADSNSDDVEMLEIEGEAGQVSEGREGEGISDKTKVSPTTPAAGTSSSNRGGGSMESPRTPTSSLSTSAKKRKRMTPDERLKVEEEREQKRRKLQEEKAKRDEEKRKKEAERLERAEKAKQEKAERERQKEAERQERERQKELERAKKEEERKEKERQKEEELAKKAEEKKKREEEKARELEEKERERKQKELEKKKKAGVTAGSVALMQNYVKKLQPAPQPKEYKAETGGSKRVSEGDAESDKENSNSGVGEAGGNVEGGDGEKQEIVVEVPPGNENDDVQLVGELKQTAAKFCPFPFQIKTNMALAPILRRKALTEEEKCVVDKALAKNVGEGAENVGRKELIERVKRKEIRKGQRTKIVEDVKIVMEDLIKPSEGYVRCRMKLLQFDENRRPAYWGTYKRRPVKVTPLNPWEKEEGLDYEFDSDDEWEDEPDDAEEIENSDGDEEAEDPTEGEPVDEDDEEGWMVPHGYLSDSENEGEAMDIETVKLREKEFFNSLKEQIKLGLPVIQTERLSNFKMIFPPKKIRKSSRQRVEASAEAQQCSKGFLSLSLPSDDEDDKDWTDDEGMELSDNEKNAAEGASTSNDKEMDISSDLESGSSSDDSSDFEFEEDDEEDIQLEKEEYSSRVKSIA